MANNQENSDHLLKIITTFDTNKDSDDEYVVQGFSEGEGGTDSSEDDDNDLIMEVLSKSKHFNSVDRVKENDPSKGFEEEMVQELEKRAKDYQARENISIQPLTVTEEKKVKVNDDGGTSHSSAILSDLELFYDPNSDNIDEAWVQRQQEKYISKQPKRCNPIGNSDAVLSCPACFTTLCRDCQRHETYKSQYRAMFTFNCDVDKSVKMKYPLQSGKSRPKKEESASLNGVEEFFHPVKCAACSTHVAMFDCDEVFHFFNVVTSH